MSLFDVLRYPVEDIESSDLEQIPAEILMPWIEECYELAARSIPSNLRNSSYRSILIIVLLLDLGRGNGKDCPERVDAFKEFFKHRLKERIKEYNSSEDSLSSFPSQIPKSDSET